MIDTGIVLYLNRIAENHQWVGDLTVFLGVYFPWMLVFFFCGWLSFSSLSSNKRVALVIVAVVSNVIARLGIVEIIRFFYHRPRPYMLHPDIHALFEVHKWSFPSGHATVFFALATAVFFFDKKLGVLFFIAAALISIARVAAGVHYPSDILGGMAVGIGVTYMVLHYIQSKRSVE